MNEMNEDENSSSEEKKIIAVCVIAALTGIAILLAYAKMSAPVEKNIGELSSEDAGHLILVKARIERISFTQNGNAILKICARTCTTAFVSKQLVEKMNASTLDLNSLHKNAMVAIEGIVEEHATGLSLRILTPDAIDFLGYAENQQ